VKRNGSLRYECAKHGHIEVRSGKVVYNLHGVGRGGLPWELALETSGPVPERWTPEGWLGRVGPLGILPCRYMVHSLATPAKYSFKAPGGLSSSSGHEDGQDTSFDFGGHGLVHLETNYGECFPEGWMYVQGHGSGSAEGVRLLLTGGRFKIGPLKPLTWLLCLRVPGLPALDFRTTDLDIVKVRRLSVAEKELSLEFKRRLSWLKGSSPTVHLRLTAPPSTFSSDGGLYVPTTFGFARSPGAVESFAGTAEVRVTGLPEGKSCELKLEGCIFEFGGTFQDPAVCAATESTS